MVLLKCVSNIKILTKPCFDQCHAARTSVDILNISADKLLQFYSSVNREMGTVQGLQFRDGNSAMPTVQRWEECKACSSQSWLRSVWFCGSEKERGISVALDYLP